MHSSHDALFPHLSLRQPPTVYFIKAVNALQSIFD